MITDKMRPYYMSIMDDLLDFWLKSGRFMSEGNLFMEVCKRFGNRLLVEVCPFIEKSPLHFGVHEDDDDLVGECAIGAIEIMREFDRGGIKRIAARV